MMHSLGYLFSDRGAAYHWLFSYHQTNGRDSYIGDHQEMQLTSARHGTLLKSYHA